MCKFVLLLNQRKKKPGAQEDFTEDIATQGIGSQAFDMELRESTIATRCSVLMEYESTGD